MVCPQCDSEVIQGTIQGTEYEWTCMNCKYWGDKKEFEVISDRFKLAEYFAKFGFEIPKQGNHIKLYYTDDNSYTYGSFSNYIPMVWDREGTAWVIDTEERILSRNETYDLKLIVKVWYLNIPKNGILCHFERNLNSGVFEEIKRVMRYKTESNQNTVVDADDRVWFVERFKPIEE